MSCTAPSGEEEKGDPPPPKKKDGETEQQTAAGDEGDKGQKGGEGGQEGQEGQKRQDDQRGEEDQGRCDSPKVVVLGLSDEHDENCATFPVWFVELCQQKDTQEYLSKCRALHILERQDKENIFLPTPTYFDVAQGEHQKAANIAAISINLRARKFIKEWRQRRQDGLGGGGECSGSGSK